MVQATSISSKVCFQVRLLSQASKANLSVIWSPIATIVIWVHAKKVYHTQRLTDGYAVVLICLDTHVSIAGVHAVTQVYFIRSLVVQVLRKHLPEVIVGAVATYIEVSHGFILTATVV
jgi:hypothetical protein